MALAQDFVCIRFTWLWKILAISALLPCRGQSSGCGMKYLAQAEKFVQASGTAMNTSGAHPLKHQLESHRKACREAGGCFANVQVDLLSYTSRLAGDKTQKLRNFYETQLTAEDRTDLRAGVALCVPEACQGQLEMLPLLAKMYYFSLAGIGDDPTLPVFKEDSEINATFLFPEPEALAMEPVAGQDRTSLVSTTTDATHDVEFGEAAQVGLGLGPGAESSQITDPLVAAKQCVEDTQKHSDDGGAPFGVAFIPVRVCWGSGSAPPEVLHNIALCGRMGGRLMNVQFDLVKFVARADSDEGTRWDEVNLRSVRTLGEFYTTVVGEVVRDFARGVGLCLPRSCSGEGIRGLPRIVVDIFVAGASDAHPEMATISVDFIPDPRWGRDLNVSSWSASIPEGSPGKGCVPPDEPADEWAVFEGSANVSKGELETWEEEDGAPGLLNNTGFRVPWWYGCGGPGMKQEWRDFAILIQETFLRDPTRRITRTLAEAADSLVSSNWVIAHEWAHTAAQYSRLTCDLQYTHIQSVPSTIEFSPAFYMLAGSKTDSRWWRVGSWQRAAHFCPYGYMAALYIRARSSRLAGLRTSAVKDLEAAREMLGPCSEMDLLDNKIWGVRALDVELSLLREELIDALPQVFERTELAGAGQCARSAPQGVPAQRPQCNPQNISEPRDFLDVWPEPLHDFRSFTWHAMQLNTLVRLWTREEVRKGGLVAAPRIAMLTFPQYLCLFVLPTVLRVWSHLPLALFYVGKQWERHEKCPSCMAEYGRRFVRTSYLQDLPVKMSGKASEAMVTLHIDWTLGLTHHEMLSLLRDFMEQEPEVRAADVFLCTSPLWLCTSLRMVSLKPIVTLCLVNVDLGAPPDLKDTVGIRAYRQILKRAFRHFVKDLPAGPPLKALLVREDLGRSYYDIGLVETGFAHASVAALSTYLQARYRCSEGADVLVMREGSALRWGPTFRGRLFYATLQQFETHASPWRFKILYNSRLRLSYDELAHHRAALWIPLTPDSKMTLKDLFTMEIPVFLPSLRLQASISARIQFHGCRKLARAEAPWAYTLCREVKYPAAGLHMRQVFRYPHAMHFDSITDLMLQLTSKGCPELEEISAQMRRWNEVLIADDAEFWKNAILALAAWGAPGRANSPERNGTAGDAGSNSSVLPAFRLPQGPPDWAPAEGRVTTACSPLAAHCRYEHGSGNALDDAGKEPYTTSLYECCANAYVLEHGPLGPNLTLASNVNKSVHGGCLVDPSQCSDDLLMYGTHLLQELPPLTR